MDRNPRNYSLPFAALGGILAIVMPVGASAQESDSTSSHLESIKACQAEADPATRLACFDAAATAIVGASEAGELRIVDRAEVRKTRRKLFGFSLPDFGIFGKRDKDGKDEDEIEEIETTIQSVTGSYQTGYTIRTEEGAVWRIDKVPGRLLEPKPGDKMVIKNAALTAYFIRINGQGGVKGSRVR
ncbi:MAG: hypothetical protein R3E14_03370 [Erythrobacter sp.]